MPIQDTSDTNGSTDEKRTLERGMDDDFTRSEGDRTFPRYKAKFASSIDTGYVENELVLVRETDAITGSKQIYQLPKSVCSRASSNSSSRMRRPVAFFNGHSI